MYIDNLQFHYHIVILDLVELYVHFYTFLNNISVRYLDHYNGKTGAPIGLPNGNLIWKHNFGSTNYNIKFTRNKHTWHLKQNIKAFDRQVWILLQFKNYKKQCRLKQFNVFTQYKVRQIRKCTNDFTKIIHIPPINFRVVLVYVKVEHLLNLLFEFCVSEPYLAKMPYIFHDGFKFFIELGYYQHVA